MASVLMVNLGTEKKNLLRVLSIRLNFSCHEVFPGQQSCMIYDLLAGTAGDAAVRNPFRDEMLIMDGFTHENLNFLLNELIRTGNTIMLKAVTTPVNVRWSISMLHANLIAENREMHARSAEGYQ